MINFPEAVVSFIYSSGVKNFAGFGVLDIKFAFGEIDWDKSQTWANPLCRCSGNFCGPRSKLNLDVPLENEFMLAGVEALYWARPEVFFGGLGVVVFGPKGNGAVLKP